MGTTGMKGWRAVCFTNRHDFFDVAKLSLDQQRGAVVATEAFGLSREGVVVEGGGVGGRGGERKR